MNDSLKRFRVPNYIIYIFLLLLLASITYIENEFLFNSFLHTSVFESAQYT